MAKTEAIPYTNYIVPILLLIGWIVGCVLMVYFVFS
ncbi:sarcoplasmic/endoplasmic reticulum calcium ATPase regulator DWORF [Pogona vitticeps]|uniref:Sarcoplasmic/endoplasmic reticulum calcium ATPase regulator DWORF n=1 Tax=Pogona vitticeps TaxID=103695 RepID=A0ABM5FVE1_9SAUR